MTPPPRFEGDEKSAVVRSLELQVDLTAIVARGGRLDRLLQGWQHQTGEPIAVFNRLGRPIGRSDAFPVDVLNDISALLTSDSAPRLGESAELDSSSVEVEPFAGNDVVRGFAARVRSDDPAASLAAPAMRSLLALEYERHWYQDEPSRRLRKSHLNRLIEMTDEAGARAFLRSIGVDFAELRGLAIEAHTTTHAEVLMDDLVAVLNTALIRQTGRIVECVVRKDPRQALAEYGLDVPLGLGTPVAPHRAARTMEQATLALETSRRLGVPIEYVDGHSHEFLIRVAPADYLESFANAALSAIESARGGSALRETLYTWLAERRSVDVTADLLNVHRHTVRNRLQRIAQLTGHDLESIETQTELWLALKARGMPQRGVR